tara:strand:- start:2248 stop:3696 length:1449 start_codon:yes stop_codon:yes gene_type:complete
MWSCKKKLDILYRSQSALGAFERRNIDTFPQYTDLYKVYNVTEKQPLQFKKNNFFYKEMKINKWLRVPLEQLLVETKSFNCDYYIDLTNLVEKQFLKAELRSGKTVMFIENLEFLPVNPQDADPENGSVMLIRIGRNVYNFYKNISRNLDSEFSGEGIQTFEDVCDTNYTFFTLSEENYKMLSEEKQECFISDGFAYIQANVHKPKKNDIIFRNGVFRSETTYGNILFTETFIEPGKSAQKFYIKAFSVLSTQVTLQVSEFDRYFIKVEDDNYYLGFKYNSFIKLTKSGKNILWSSRIGSGTVYYFKYTDTDSGKQFYIISYITIKKQRNENDPENGDNEINNVLVQFKENNNLNPGPIPFENFLTDTIGMDVDSVTDLMNLSRQYPQMSEESHTRRGHFYSKYMLYMEMDINLCIYDPIIFEKNLEDVEKPIEEKDKVESLSETYESKKQETPVTQDKGLGVSERNLEEPLSLSSKFEEVA